MRFARLLPGLLSVRPLAWSPRDSVVWGMARASADQTLTKQMVADHTCSRRPAVSGQLGQFGRRVLAETPR